MAPPWMTDSWRIQGPRLVLRLVVPGDVGPHYAAWLANPAINACLETRWRDQDEASIHAFVAAQRADPHSVLLAMCLDGQHIGNLKIGPARDHHAYADLSYFIGESDAWGQGLASEAIAMACDLAFTRWRLHRLVAGVYGANVGSSRALERNCFVHEGTRRQQVQVDDGWDDLLEYGLLSDEWQSRIVVNYTEESL